MQKCITHKAVPLLTIGLAALAFSTATLADNNSTASSQVTALDENGHIKSSAEFQQGLGKQVKSLGKSVTGTMNQLTDKALTVLGTPYRYGGTSLTNGIDCSALVMKLYEKVAGVNLPRTAAEQAKATDKITRNELQPGDLVFFNTLKRAYSHVGIYVGDGKFVHAPRTGKNVRVDSLDNSYWNKHYSAARRVNIEE